MTLRYDVNCSILFTELPVLQRPAAAAARASTPSSSGGRGRISRCRPTPTSTRFVTAVAGRRRAAGRASTSSPATCPAATAAWCPWPGARRSEFRDNIDVTVGIGERLGCQGLQRPLRQPGRRRPRRAAGRPRPPRTSRCAAQGRRPHRRRPCWSSRSAAPTPYPLRTAADARRRDRPGPAASRRRQRRLPAATSTTWPSTATTSTPPSTTTPTGSRTSRSPTPRAAASPAPASCDLDRPGSASSRRRGYDGWVGLEYKPSGTTRRRASRWLPVERRCIA